jgi:hypothetical protein
LNCTTETRRHRENCLQATIVISALCAMRADGRVLGTGGTEGNGMKSALVISVLSAISVASPFLKSFSPCLCVSVVNNK